MSAIRPVAPGGSLRPLARVCPPSGQCVRVRRPPRRTDTPARSQCHGGGGGGGGGGGRVRAGGGGAPPAAVPRRPTDGHSQTRSHPLSGRPATDSELPAVRAGVARPCQWGAAQGPLLPAAATGRALRRQARSGQALEANARQQGLIQVRRHRPCRAGRRARRGGCGSTPTRGRHSRRAAAAPRGSG